MKIGDTVTNCAGKTGVMLGYVCLIHPGYTIQVRTAAGIEVWKTDNLKRIRRG